MYDKYEFDAATRREMQEFDELLTGWEAKLEAEKKSYEAMRDADWERIKAKENPPKPKPANEYLTRGELLASCRKTTPNGATYISLGEYYQKLYQS